MTTGFVTRFAPSPTGFLHRGHAFSALTTFHAARDAGGRFLLRLEDIDATRCRPEYEAAIYEDLAWLGLGWETPVRRQSDHLAEYGQVLDRLAGMGLIYRCFRTRSEIAAQSAAAPHGPVDAFRGAPLPLHEEAQRLERGDGYAWRLSLEAAAAHLGGFERLRFFVEGQGWGPARPELAGDVVLARKDVRVSYHLASVWDDALQGVTHVIRGLDLAEAPHIQVLLQALLDLPTPVYRHHPLILGADGKRLAKRERSETLQDLRNRGITPAQIREGLGFG